MCAYIGTRKSKRTDISSSKRFGQRCVGPKMSWHSMNRTNVSQKRPYYCIVGALKFEFYLFMYVFKFSETMPPKEPVLALGIRMLLVNQITQRFIKLKDQRN